jgi:hypothetical protein
MKATLKHIHCPDDVDFDIYKPDDSNNFGLFFQLIAGSDAYDNGDDWFNLMVCSPNWLESYIIERNSPISVNNYLFAKEYNFEVIYTYITNFINQIEADNLNELYNRIGELAMYECRYYLSDKIESQKKTFAELLSVTSSEIEYLELYEPKTPDLFCIPLTVYYNIIPTDGLTHSIHLNLCTPSWIRDVLMEDTPIFLGTNLLVVNNYDYNSIFEFLNEYISNLKGLDSQEIILKMNDLGRSN